MFRKKEKEAPDPKSEKMTVTVVEDLLHLSKTNDLVGAIDQGTSSTRFLLFTPKADIAAWAQMEHTQIFPPGEDKVGWHEHDPLEIWNNVVACMEAVVQALTQKQLKFTINAIGITNQRETTLAWNATTGKPYYNAIVWDDIRTTSIAAHIANGNPDRLREKTGLPLASYFAGTKVKWLLDNVPTLKEDLKSAPEQVRFGTMDTWVLYQLTGKPSGEKDAANVGGLFLTDVSNAARWLFCDLQTVQWDQKLVDTVCSPHSVPLSALPEIRPSSQVYANCVNTGIAALDGVPVASILGDQQAALFGQCAFEPGEAKNTYGTGMFLMMNTGTQPVPSTHGLLTTIAYQINDQVYYALEGSVSHSGSTIQWLRDQLKIIKTAAETGDIATEHNDGLYFVPAFAGLFAPHWRSDARGCIVGMTASHHKGHICRAALEAAAYQARELFDAIYADSDVRLKSLKVDGGGTKSSLLMQFQADIMNLPVVKPKTSESSAMGAAFCAGLAVGVWKDLKEIRELYSTEESFLPNMSEVERQKNWKGWKKAVTKSLDWVDEEEEEEEQNFEDACQGEDPVMKTTTKTTREIPPEADTVTSGYSTLSLTFVAALGLGAGFLMGRHRK